MHLAKTSRVISFSLILFAIVFMAYNFISSEGNDISYLIFSIVLIGLALIIKKFGARSHGDSK